jgi:hypothetical protein
VPLKGGVQGIVAGMTVHTEETDVIDIAVRVLTNMSSDIDAEHMTIMVQEGAVQAVVEVFNQYIDNLDVCSINHHRTYSLIMFPMKWNCLVSSNGCHYNRLK